MKGIAEKIASRIKGEIEVNVPMSGQTTFKVGGNADLVVYPADIDDLKEIARIAKVEGLAVFVLGLGSNLLVGDEGIRGIVISLTRGLRDIAAVGDTGIDCGAGASLASAVSFAAEAGLGGLEFLAGIPGSVGGALRMNAGAYGSEMKDVVETLSLVDGSGNAVTIPEGELDFSYRNLRIDADCTITGCRFALINRERAVIKAKMKEFAMKRAEKQPLGKPTAGSVFKNPPGDFAGRLIEEAGLKGLRVGMARVSERHANFIENMGGAKARDIVALMELIVKKVYEKSGIALDPEVKMVGEGLPAMGGGSR